MAPAGIIYARRETETPTRFCSAAGRGMVSGSIRRGEGEG